MSVLLVSDSTGINESDGRFRIAGMPLSAIAFLLLSVLIDLLWSHYQLLWTDEFYTLETASVSSIAQLVHLQLATPISIDTVAYNSAAHAAIGIFGASAFAIRLPAMCGYLLMQVCLFYFVRRITTERAATFALAFPALIGCAMYSIQARSYGFLLGLAALAMVSWQAATRRESKRTIALVVLSFSVAIAINTHYYGVLLLIPLCGAELFRTFERRRVDVPVYLSIAAGMAGIIILVPFARSVSQFRDHYFLKGVDYHFISHSYLWLLVGYEGMSVSMQHFIGITVTSFLLAMVAGFIYFPSRFTVRLPHAEAVFILLLAALPLFGFLLAYFVTKVIEGRYILPTVIGMTALLAILIAPILGNKIIGRIVLASLFVAIAGIGVLRIRSEKEQAAGTLKSLVLNSLTRRSLEEIPDQPIYVSNPGLFQTLGYYAPSSNIRSRITLVYSRDEEMLNQNNDYLSITGANMRAAGIPHIVPYESVSINGTERLFLLLHNPWDWTDRALADSHAQITYLGPAYGGDLVSVRFP
jgi:hypothetical protein